MLLAFDIRFETLSEKKSPIRQFRIIKSQKDLDEYLKARQSSPRIMAGLLSLEGAHCLQGDLGCEDSDLESVMLKRLNSG
jgi:hypothetical protein